ncbi:GNAT family N-acetyltransferase [Seonamhaeicola marinus]|uniref:GNAT family N-acetyltransferase n=1 Tax=Seonamhaeicola marinus TaxID=1912246 RepID=A0A5D0HNB6_9FLAO|nr:GNAT family N-acetyltransferase [Seonamhaeicola marinus]TYA71859.1 GNAT family N-acetyltransferase [Seonamhaeicola marinus]
MSLRSVKLEFKTIKNNSDRELYNSYVELIGNNSVFYSLDYCNSSNETENISYFLLKEDDEPKVLMPIHINEIKSKGVQNLKEKYYDAISPYGYNGPLFNSTTECLLKKFWEEIDTWYKDNNVVTEFIRFNLNGNQENYTGFLIESLRNVKGKLTNFESIWTNFKQKARNNYRRALKHNLKIEFLHKNIEDTHIENFYHIYMSTMKRTGATVNYFYPKSYFLNLIKNNIENIVLVFVYFESKPISTELIIIDNHTLNSYLGGTLSDYFNYRPNDFLKVETIKWGLENNMKYYSLGGGRKDNDNLYSYKKTFFPKDNDAIFYTGRKIINNEVYNILLRNIDVDYTEMSHPIDDSNNYFPLYRNKKNTMKEKDLEVMTSKLEVITTKENWDAFLAETDFFDFYHTYDYHQLSKDEKDKAILLKYTEGDYLIGIPLLIRNIENTAYYDATSVYGYCGPIRVGVPENFNNIHFKKALSEFLSQEKIVSVFSRLNPFISVQKEILQDIGEIIELGNVVNIDLTKDVAEQRTLFSKTTKRYINKCRKAFDVRKGVSEEDLMTFMDLYYENMDRVNAKKHYYFSKEYFLDFIKSTDYETDVLMAIDKETQEIVSAAMMVKTNTIIQYHISGTRNAYLNLSPIRLLIDEMRINASGDGKYKYFNLGGGLGNNEDELFRFKSSFSKDFKKFKIWKHIVNQEVYDNLVEEKNVTDKTSNFFPLYRSGE